MPVGEMLARMSSQELTAWQAFDQVEPVGPRRGDYHAALIASLIANVNRDPKRQPYRLEQFLLFQPRTPQPPEVLRAKFLAAIGGNRGDAG